MRRFNHLIVQWPKLTLLLGLLLTSFLAYHAWHLRIDSSAKNLYAQNDPNRKYYEEMRKLFGSDDTGVIGLVTENVYTPATLEKIKRITAEVEKVGGVESVQSLTNVPYLITDVGDLPLLIPRIPTDPAALDALRRKVEDNPIYLNVVSRDGKGAAILIFFKQQIGEDELLQRGRDDRLQEIVAREQGPEELYLTGNQHITLNESQLMQRDLRTFTPLSLAVIMVVLGFCFRNVRGVLLPLMSVLCGVVWTLGIMVLAGEAITIGTEVLPPLLIVIGSTYSIYVIAQYEDEIQKGGTAAEVVLRALTRVSVPVTVAAFTTVVGFVTLLVNRIGTIRALGLYAAVGFACLTVVVLTLMPATLTLLPLPRQRVARKGSDRLAALLARVGNFDRQHRVPIMVAAGLLVIPCVWGVTRIRADSNFIQYFKKNSPVRRAYEIIGEKIGGTQNFDIIVNSGKKDGATAFDLLERINGLQTYLATLPGIDQTLSIVDFGELIDRAIQSNRTGAGVGGSKEGKTPTPPSASSAGAGTSMTTFWEHPERLRGVMQLVHLKPDYFAAWLSPDSSIARVWVRTRLTSSSDIMHAAEEVRRYGKEHFPPEVTIRPTGSLISSTTPRASSGAKSPAWALPWS
jgi:predicted RND superfamily exporter protein